MRLYSGSSKQFIHDTIQNQIAEKLKNAFFNYFRYYPSPAEINSWKNSLRAISQVFQYGSLLDHGIILEYQLPLTSKRLDCLICGKDEDRRDNAVVIELKQWDKCEPSESDNEVVTWVGGGKRDTLHPSVQVGQYHQYLLDAHTAFNSEVDPVLLHACSYLHNYNYYENDVLLDKKFESIINKYPLFTAEEVDPLKEFLIQRLLKGNGLDVLKKVEESRYRPSKKLMDHVGYIIKGKSEYVLLDEQLVVYDTVLQRAKKGFHDKRKSVVIIKGGPGTGKSVIALNLMSDLLLQGYNAHYATGSRAFTETLRKIIGSRGSAQFKYFNSYAGAEKNAIDVLIADEAHRIRVSSNSRFTPKVNQSSLSQIEELIDISKVAVFFIDDNQVVRPNEIGSVEYIKNNAEKKNCEVIEFELEAQFRCNGSDAFVNWINNTLGIKRTANVIWDQHEEFDFKIFPSPDALEKAIFQKANEGYTARLTAGFCWPWSMPNPDGTLKDDVVIGDYRRPWDAKPDAKHLAPGIPKASLWAYDPNGLKQIGCVYTAQGFEFDYVGVIVGEDLAYDFDRQEWVGHPENCSDTVVKRSKGKFVDLVKNTYRVLLSRGMKGCYVYFMNKDTERFFKSRIERLEETKSSQPVRHLKLIHSSEITDQNKYTRYLPVFSLKAAAGKFLQNDNVSEEGWIEIGENVKPSNKLFVAKVVGHSMEPLITSDSYCIFRFGVEGTRQNKIVLVQHDSIRDPDFGGSFTVKRYKSKKTYGQGDTWKHDEIVLEPINKDYDPIVIKDAEEGEFKVIAEFVSTI